VVFNERVNCARGTYHKFGTIIGKKALKTFSFCMHGRFYVLDTGLFVCLFVFLPEGKIDNNLLVETGIFFVPTVCYGEIFIKLALWPKNTYGSQIII